MKERYEVEARFVTLAAASTMSDMSPCLQHADADRILGPLLHHALPCHACACRQPAACMQLPGTACTLHLGLKKLNPLPS